MVLLVWGVYIPRHCRSGMADNHTQPDEDNPTDWIFSAETKHAETEEVGFTILILPVEVQESAEHFGAWLQFFVESTLQIPIRFTVTDAEGEEIIAGKAGVQE